MSSLLPLPQLQLLLLSSLAYSVECEQTVCLTHFWVCCCSTWEESGSHGNIRLTGCTLYHGRTWAVAYGILKLIQDWWTHVVLTNFIFPQSTPSFLLVFHPPHHQNNYSSNNNKNAHFLWTTHKNKPNYYFSVFIRMWCHFEIFCYSNGKLIYNQSKGVSIWVSVPLVISYHSHHGDPPYDLRQF